MCNLVISKVLKFWREREGSEREHELEEANSTLKEGGTKNKREQAF